MWLIQWQPCSFPKYQWTKRFYFDKHHTKLEMIDCFLITIIGKRSSRPQEFIGVANNVAIKLRAFNG